MTETVGVFDERSQSIRTDDPIDATGILYDGKIYRGRTHADAYEQAGFDLSELADEPLGNLTSAGRIRQGYVTESGLFTEDGKTGRRLPFGDR